MKMAVLLMCSSSFAWMPKRFNVGLSGRVDEYAQLIARPSNHIFGTVFRLNEEELDREVVRPRPKNITELCDWSCY